MSIILLTEKLSFAYSHSMILNNYWGKRKKK